MGKKTSLNSMVKPSKEVIEQLKEKYPRGSKIRLIFMRDSLYPVARGTLGKVVCIDDLGQIEMIWDCGSEASLIPYLDRFEKWGNNNG
jgi:hypothetical protein